MKLLVILTLMLAAGQAEGQTMPGMTMPPAPAEPKANPAAPTSFRPTTAPGPQMPYIGKRVEYDLYVADMLVNFTGKVRTAVALNGHLPGPTLRFTEGDTAVVRVHNRLKGATSMHWHGLVLPNKEDGVPYLTTAPILPGSTHTFTFPLIQHGTYWYHAHGLEEQSGMYGSLVIKPRQAVVPMREYVLLLSDWTDEKPAEVLRYLKRAGEWYAVKKGATQSYGEALAAGYFKDKVKQEWGRMPGTPCMTPPSVLGAPAGTRARQIRSAGYRAGSPIPVTVPSRRSSGSTTARSCRATTPIGWLAVRPARCLPGPDCSPVIDSATSPGVRSTKSLWTPRGSRATWFWPRRRVSSRATVR